MLLFLLLNSIAIAQSPIPPGAKLIKLTNGLTQPEGPLWKDSVLLFSDIAANLIYKWSPADSTLKPYLQPSYNSNGLTLDRQGRLIFTQMGLRRVSRQETNGTITPLTSTFRGKRYNSPNDIVVKSDGAIFFTDPDYNVPSGQTVELPFKGIYRIGTAGVVTLLDSTFDKPNGICFSPDEKILYVDNTPEGEIYAWDVENDSVLTNKRLFYTVSSDGVDGMKVDTTGNIYCTSSDGIWIISPEGIKLGQINMTSGASNCAWGDADRKTLYITGTYGNNLYKIRLASSTGVIDEDAVLPADFHLYPNFPNPFNPTTVISYQLSVTSYIELKVFDMLGREVATLVDGMKDAGYYTSTFDGSRFSSGVYFVQIIALPQDGSQSITKTIKMLMMK